MTDGKSGGPSERKRRTKQNDDSAPPTTDAKGNSAGRSLPRLTRYELEIMDVVWRLGECTVHDVCAGLSRPLAYTTIMTTLNLLESRKQVLERTKRGRSFVYRPLCSRNEISRSILTELKEVLFDNSMSSLVLNLLKDEQVSASEVAALREALEQLEPRE